MSPGNGLWHSICVKQSDGNGPRGSNASRLSRRQSANFGKPQKATWKKRTEKRRYLDHLLKRENYYDI